MPEPREGPIARYLSRVKALNPSVPMRINIQQFLISAVGIFCVILGQSLIDRDESPKFLSFGFGLVTNGWLMQALAISKLLTEEAPDTKHVAAAFGGAGLIIASSHDALSRTAAGKEVSLLGKLGYLAGLAMMVYAIADDDPRKSIAAAASGVTAGIGKVFVTPQNAKSNNMYGLGQPMFVSGMLGLAFSNSMTFSV